MSRRSGISRDRSSHRGSEPNDSEPNDCEPNDCEPNETLWLFAEFAEAANDASPSVAAAKTPGTTPATNPAATRTTSETPVTPSADASADPLQAAQQLARKMPYLPRRRGERERAGHAIFRLLLASLHREDRAA